jgi:hypothetical protein
MKELKLSKDGELDKEALLKHLDALSPEGYWKSIFKVIGEQCLKHFASKKGEILREFENSPFNIKKDQCDPTSVYISACIGLEAFMVIIFASFQFSLSH